MVFLQECLEQVRYFSVYRLDRPLFGVIVMRYTAVVSALLLATMFLLPASAQIIVLPREPHIPIVRSFQVRQIEVDARIRDQVAQVQLSQTFYNPGHTVIEAEYLFPLPEEGGIDDFVLLVNGKELPGRILPKDEARRIYERIVRQRKDPALLEFMGRGAYRTSVFPIAARSDCEVTLRYTHLLKRSSGLIEFAYPFRTHDFTAKPIQKLRLSVDIDSQDPIKSVYSPTHDVEVQRKGEHRASVRLVQHDVIPSRDFRLFYSLGEGAVTATLLSYRPRRDEDGYFLMLASPRVEKREVNQVPKSVVFVLDKSGSMAGKKIDQARGALRFVLDNLIEGDTFNIIAYDDRIHVFKDELQSYDQKSRSEAVDFVENIRDGGSTDIGAALQTAMGMLRDDSRPNYVLFLTDGLPTAGEKREMAIASNCRSANKVGARVFAFGVGYDVNARLLDRITEGNGGTSEYVKPDEDIEVAISRFFSKMARPVLAGVELELSGTRVNRSYPRDIPDLFDGGQIIWIGRYQDSGETTIRVHGRVGSESQQFSFPATLRL